MSLFVDKILRGLSEGMKSIDYSHREVYVGSGLEIPLYLARRYKIFFENLTVAQLVKKF